MFPEKGENPFSGITDCGGVKMYGGLTPNWRKTFKPYTDSINA